MDNTSWSAPVSLWPSGLNNSSSGSLLDLLVSSWWLPTSKLLELLSTHQLLLDSCSLPWPLIAPEDAAWAILVGFCFLLGFVAELLCAAAAAPLLQQHEASAAPRIEAAAASQELQLTPASKPPPLQGTLTPTAAEWLRFLTARHGDEAAAAAQWRAHVAFRRCLPPAKTIGNGLPDYMHFLQGRRCRLGGTIVLIMGAMHDPKMGIYDDYTMAIAAFLDAHLSRDSAERVTVIADCRGGVGWPNPPPSLYHSRSLARMLRDNFPERLARIIVYPVPWIFLAMYHAARPALGTRTAAKLRLIGGPIESRHMPSPPGLLEYIDAEAAAACEALREAKLPESRRQVRRKLI